MGISGPPQAGPFPVADTQATSVYAGPFGRVFVDDSSGAEFMLVDCQEAFTIGEVVVIDAAGAATAITNTSRGRVGVIAGTVGGSDTAAWAQIYGPVSSVLCSSDVTTGGLLIANVSTDTGTVGEATSTVGNIVWSAYASGAATTATSPVGPGGLCSLVLNRPYVTAQANQFILTT